MTFIKFHNAASKANDQMVHNINNNSYNIYRALKYTYVSKRYNQAHQIDKTDGF